MPPSESDKLSRPVSVFDIVLADQQGVGSEQILAAKAKKSAKLEIENNEDPKEEAPVLMPPEEDVPEPLIEDLPGVGPATAEKLA